MKPLLRALQFFKDDLRAISLCLFLLLLSTGLNLLKPWPLALIVDSLLDDRPLPPFLSEAIGDWAKAWQLGVLIAAMLFLHFGHAALSGFQNLSLIRVGLNGLARVRRGLFERLQRLSLRFYQQTNLGDLVYRASWDTYAFQTLMQHGLFALFTGSLGVIFMLAFMWAMNPMLTLAVLALLPLVLMVMFLFGRPMNRRSLIAHQADSQVTSLLQQNISAMPLIQSYVRELDQARQFTGQNVFAREKRLSQHSMELVYLAVIAVLFAAGLAAITWLGTRQVWAQQLSVGQLLVFLAYLGQLYDPLNQLTRAGSNLSDASAGTQRVLEILDAPIEVIEHPEARTIEAQGLIQFDRVCFAYQSERPVLRDITFNLEPRTTTLILGPSGAGKSTLLQLLPRFFDPASGAVCLDGIDLRQLQLKNLRAQISLLLQEPILLPATIAENIAYGRPGATPAEIEAAARAAHAHEFIGRLPQGYQTVVGEAAAHLSVGEKQRINLARAFLKNAPILLLDEPTSALDAESEALVVAALNAFASGRTTLIVSHRMDSELQAHTALVLQEGRLIAQGAPKEILSRR